jgi:hypothetical protein
MKPLHCDQVFDVLTRGPFPTGDASDYWVEEHLGCCHECRHLAEALRPAVELFHEAIQPEDSRELPGYRGVHARQSGGPGLAQLVAQAIETEAPAATARPVLEVQHAWHVWLASWKLQLTTALALGMLLMLTLSGSHSSGLPLAQVSTHPVGYHPSTEGFATLAALPLSTACQLPAAATQNAGWHCCTQCHAAQRGPQVSSAVLTHIATSCQACHR